MSPGVKAGRICFGSLGMAMLRMGETGSHSSETQKLKKARRRCHRQFGVMICYMSREVDRVGQQPENIALTLEHWNEIS